MATAESLTGGSLADLLSGTPGASSTYVGGVVCYATRVKRELLGVRAERVISADCAAQLAEGVRRVLGGHWGVGTTGVAGPDRQEDQPVGTVFVGVAGPDGTEVRECHFDGDRAAVRQQASQAALDLLAECLSEDAG